MDLWSMEELGGRLRVLQMAWNGWFLNVSNRKKLEAVSVYDFGCLTHFYPQYLGLSSFDLVFNF